MLLEDRIRLIAVEDDRTTCFVCGRKIGAGMSAIRVTVDVKISIVSTSMSREAHIDCAKEIARRIDAIVASLDNTAKAEPLGK